MALLNICIGAEQFKEIRENGYCYVDKTSFIEELFRTAPAKVSLITRPRRFGKTLTMTMLQEFFDIRQDSRAIFEGLAVSRNTELCEKWMNRFPAVFITLKGAEGRNYDFALGQISDLLRNICLEHAYLLESEKIAPALKKSLSRLNNGEASEKEMTSALQLLCLALKAYWDKPVILLIDEYDVPISCAEQNGYYNEMVGFMRSFLGAALKTNASLKFAVLTGCLRISKESIFTGLNNFRCYGISERPFADKIGFTAQEVRALLEFAGLSEKEAAVREWYDGYRFGDGTEIYCPWDVLLYISDLQYSLSAQPQAYWNNTSGNAIVRTLINRAERRELRDKIERLIEGVSIEEKLAEDMTYDIVYKNERNIWTMLYLTGYLTKAAEQPGGGLTALAIPNKEVRQIFTDTVSLWFEDKIAENSLGALAEALWRGDSSAVQKMLTQILYSTISCYDSAENYYHDFMTGLIRGAGLYIASNAEKGLGRPDIVIEDRVNERAIIIELKCAREYKDLESRAEEALKQTEERRYARGLAQYIKKATNYGIAFWRKECCVKAAEAAQ